MAGARHAAAADIVDTDELPAQYAADDVIVNKPDASEEEETILNSLSDANASNVTKTATNVTDQFEDKSGETAELEVKPEAVPSQINRILLSPEAFPNLRVWPVTLYTGEFSVIVIHVFILFMRVII